jgi:hypothetical protein
MITTLVGKTFLKTYNEKYNQAYSAKEFFEKEFHRLFFDNPKFLMSVTNSPFDQGYKNKRHLTTAGRLYDLQQFNEKIELGKVDASIFLGSSASEDKDFAVTSGLVSDLDLAFDKDDVLCSWFGAALGIGVAGGYTILIDDPTITLRTFEGWKYYRKYLDDPALQGILLANKINSWNGQWLRYRLSSNYEEGFDFRILEREKFFRQEDKSYGIETLNWSNLFFSLSLLYPERVFSSYIYSFGQMNKTIGFIPIYLKAGTRLKTIFKQLFHTELPFKEKSFQSLFGMHIKRACELGNIGLQALRPENLTKYIDEDKTFSFKKDEDILLYQSYKTWLIAMLSKNKEEITDYTSEIAKLIQRYRANAKGTDRKNLIEKDLLGSKTKKGFLDALIVMLEGLEKSDFEPLKKLRDEVHLMTNEEFGYFNTLLKFDYAFVEKQS